mmetsp:Transcript_2396/g.5420  ORF Transcript_2396/g.5420 Transcript_2396/m.5420 type:complete len:128 (-) Transcript_2396:40-423(-)
MDARQVASLRQREACTAHETDRQTDGQIVGIHAQAGREAGRPERELNRSIYVNQLWSTKDDTPTHTLTRAHTALILSHPSRLIASHRIGTPTQTNTLTHALLVRSTRCPSHDTSGRVSHSSFGKSDT